MIRPTSTNELINQSCKVIRAAAVCYVIVESRGCGRIGVQPHECSHPSRPQPHVHAPIYRPIGRYTMAVTLWPLHDGPNLPTD